MWCFNAVVKVDGHLMAKHVCAGAVASVTVAVAEAAVGMLGASALGYKKGAMLACRGGLRLLRKAAGARSGAVAVA